MDFSSHDIRWGNGLLCSSAALGEEADKLNDLSYLNSLCLLPFISSFLTPSKYFYHLLLVCCVRKGYVCDSTANKWFCMTLPGPLCPGGMKPRSNYEDGMVG